MCWEACHDTQVSDLNPDPPSASAAMGCSTRSIERGVLSTTDVQIATALLRISRRRTPADPQDDELVRLAAAVTVRGLPPRVRHRRPDHRRRRVRHRGRHRGSGSSLARCAGVVGGAAASSAGRPVPEDSADDSTRPLVWPMTGSICRSTGPWETSVRDALVARCRPVAGSPPTRAPDRRFPGRPTEPTAPGGRGRAEHAPHHPGRWAGDREDHDHRRHHRG